MKRLNFKPTVRDLREMLDKLPDDALVVQHGPDHSFYPCCNAVETLAVMSMWGISEVDDIDDPTVEDGEQLIKVVVIE